MTGVLAICPNCGPVVSPLIQLHQGAHATFENVAVSCPQCGRDARVPDGVYDAMGSAVRLLLSSGRSLQQLESLRHALKTAAEREASREEIHDTIQTHAPELKSIADVLPKTRPELYAFITALVAIIALLKTFSGAPAKAPQTDNEIRIVVQQTVEKAIAQESKKHVGPRNRAERRARGRPPRRGHRK